MDGPGLKWTVQNDIKWTVQKTKVDGPQKMKLDGPQNCVVNLKKVKVDGLRMRGWSKMG